MGLNIMGFASSVKTNDLFDFANHLDVEISECLGKVSFEEACSNTIDEEDIYLIPLEKGSLVLTGLAFPLLEVSFKKLSENHGEISRFFYGETSMFFYYDYYKDGKFLRKKQVCDGETENEAGEQLEIEYSGMEADEVVLQLMENIAGSDVFAADLLDKEAFHYRFIEKTTPVGYIEPPQPKTEATISNQKLKPWWKFW